MPTDARITAATVSVAFVREALAAAQRQGCDPLRLRSAVGISQAMLDDPRTRVTSSTFGSLWLLIAEELDDEFFGLDSRRMKVGSFTTLSRLALRARNLREVLVSAAHFFRILLDDTVVELQLAGSEAAIVLADARPQQVQSSNRVFAHETLLVLVHGLACWLIARRIPVTQASFAYPRPDWSEEYARVYSPRLAFDAPATRLSFSALLLKAPVMQNERSLQEFLRGAPGNFILKYKDENSVSNRIRRHLQQLPPSSWPSFDELADAFHLGATTLRRRLDREGGSFSAIKDALRRDLAIRRLTQSDLSIVDIATELGFAEPSAFHRAFKQWTGLRPGMYRDARADPAD